MLPVMLTLVVVIVLVSMSMLANRKFRAVDRLPMQWSNRGEVNWTAPRVAVLAVMPVLGTLVLCAASLSSIFVDPRPGQENMVIPAMLVMALVAIGIHHLHITLIARYLGKAGD
ncbi:MAG: hypothetical protein ACT6R2_13150 [Blastomonas fulva]|uniref:hypothetical protein n=1 Tax=Blastomonas fulva TaxID=1550728 RepID=UPI0040340C58